MVTFHTAMKSGLKVSLQPQSSSGLAVTFHTAMKSGLKDDILRL